MVTRTFKLVLITLIMLSLVFGVSAATITLKTDRNQVSLNESFQLIFEAEGDVDDDPDFSPLEKEFQVLSTAQSSNFSVLNGRISSSKRWTLTVMANKSGVQSIPSISFGNDKSPETEVNVQDTNSRSGNNQQQDDIYLEASATPMNPYVQSQVIYTLKLFRAVAITKASLGDPEVTSGNAVLERIDDDKSYETTINGKFYHVIERKYAVYPQSSGIVTIAPIDFMGQISRSRFGLDPFGAPPRTIVRRSQQVILNVRKIPDAFIGSSWLPAENLTIAEEWSADPMQLLVGEPITRTLMLTAKGLISSQLPELPMWEMADLKFYPDRPELKDEKSDIGITSSRHEKAAIIPNQVGNYVLPELIVPWWNTRTDRLENAVVPERTIHVLPAIKGVSDPLEITSLTPLIPQVFQAPAENESTTDVSEQIDLSTDSMSNIWKWTTLILALIWLFTLLIWWQRDRHPEDKLSIDNNIQKPEKIKTVVKNIETSCIRNDPNSAKENLMIWAKLIWPDDPPISLGEIANRTGMPMADELINLNHVLYSNGTIEWDGKNFQDIFNKEASTISARKDQKTVDAGKLEPLFRI